MAETQLQKLTSTNQQQPTTGLQPLQAKQPNQMLQKPAQPKKMQPERLTLNDFISEAQKLGQLKTKMATHPILEQYTKETIPQLQRQLYGQGIGTGSGVGQHLAQRSTDALAKELARSGERVGLETAQQEQQFRQQEEMRMREEGTRKADQLMSLVQSGQISGTQAEDVLIQQGINPENFMTPEQVQIKRQDEQFKTLLQQTVKDPEVAMLIDNEQELDFYMKNGKTYEDEVADIISKSKTYEDWSAKKPILQTALQSYELQLTKENANWFKDERKIAGLRSKIAALKETLNLLDAGHAPKSESIGQLEKISEAPKKKLEKAKSTKRTGEGGSDLGPMEFGG